MRASAWLLLAGLSSGEALASPIDYGRVPDTRLLTAAWVAMATVCVVNSLLSVMVLRAWRAAPVSESSRLTIAAGGMFVAIGWGLAALGLWVLGS